MDQGPAGLRSSQGRAAVRRSPAGLQRALPGPVQGQVQDGGLPGSSSQPRGSVPPVLALDLGGWPRHSGLQGCAGRPSPVVRSARAQDRLHVAVHLGDRGPGHSV